MGVTRMAITATAIMARMSFLRDFAFDGEAAISFFKTLAERD